MLSEEQPKRLVCRHCGRAMYRTDGKWANYRHDVYCHHEAERRLPQNAAKRKEVEEKIEGILGEVRG